MVRLGGLNPPTRQEDIRAALNLIERFDDEAEQGPPKPWGQSTAGRIMKRLVKAGWDFGGNRVRPSAVLSIRFARFGKLAWITSISSGGACGSAFDPRPPSCA
jgi:hypothetical protein